MSASGNLFQFPFGASFVPPHAGGLEIDGRASGSATVQARVNSILSAVMHIKTTVFKNEDRAPGNSKLFNAPVTTCEF